MFRVIDRAIEKSRRLGCYTSVNLWLPTVFLFLICFPLFSFIALDRRTKNCLIVELLNRVNRMPSTYLSASIIRDFFFIFERVLLSKFSEEKDLQKTS